MVSRFLIFQKKKFNSKQLVLDGLLQVNGLVITNPFFVVPSFSFIKLLKSNIKVLKFLKKPKLTSQQDIKVMAGFKVRPINKNFIYKKKRSKPETCGTLYKKKLKFIINKHNFFHFEDALAHLGQLSVFGLVAGSFKVKDKKYTPIQKKLDSYKKILPFFIKIKDRLRMGLLHNLYTYLFKNNLSRCLTKALLTKSKLSGSCTIIQKVQKIKKKKNLVSW